MYNTKFLLESIEKLIESAKYKLSQNELELLISIRRQIEESDDEKVEKGFFDLVKFLLLIKEHIDHF